MAAYNNYAVRIPALVTVDLRLAAEPDGVSMNGPIVQAVAGTVVALRASGVLGDLIPEKQATYLYLGSQAAQCREGGHPDLKAKAGTRGEGLHGDEIATDWLQNR